MEVCGCTLEHSDPGCTFKLPDSERPCRELGGHQMVQGACPATHCREHLGGHRLEHYRAPSEICALHAVDAFEGQSMAEVAALLDVAKSTVAADEAHGLAKAGRARLNEDQIIAPQRLTRNRAA